MKPSAASLDSSKSSETSPINIGEDSLVDQLESELSATQDDLQSTLEQFEAANEEFKASHEEVMSINEELQSTNEELETSKEELQSLNEELSTANQQLAGKVDELEIKHADLENLIAATEVATVCLDTDLAIRWFTPATRELIRIKPADVGRPLQDLQNDFLSNNLVEQCGQVLQNLVPSDHEVDCSDDRTFIRRIMPYRTEDRRIGGVVITMVDITSRRKREEELRVSEESLRNMNATLEQRVVKRTELLNILQQVTQAANEARSVEEAMQTTMSKLADFNSWRVGHVWRRVEDDNSGGPPRMTSWDFWHVQAQKRFTATVTLNASNFDESFVENDETARTIYQVSREALHNAIKHAKSEEIVVEVSTSDTFQLVVRDGGVGFDVHETKPHSNGLRIMRYRAEAIGGELMIRTDLGKGTSIKLTIPKARCQP